MGDDAALQRLAEMLSEFFTTSKAVEEDLKHSLTAEFLRKCQDILFNKQLVVFTEWEDFFHDFGDRMLSSPEMYLMYVFYACRQVALVHIDVFERFLDAFALVLRISMETKHRAGVNFCKLIPDIVMVLYKKELKKQFLITGGLSQFVAYVNNLEYPESVCHRRDIYLLYAPNTRDNEYTKELTELEQKLPVNQELPESLNFADAETDKNSSFLADCVLKDTKVELPSLQNHNDSKEDSIQQRVAESDKGKVFLELAENGGNLERDLLHISDSHLKTDDSILGQMLNTELYEKIVEEVVKHNKSRSSSHEKPRGRIQMEVDVVLDHLNHTIQSLIQVLDYFDKV